MARERDHEEVLSDELVTLLFLYELKRAGVDAVEWIRLHWLCFLLENAWFAKRWKGLNYTFRLLRYGPFALELYQTEADLMAGGLIEDCGSWTFALTDVGVEFFAEELRADVAKLSCNMPFLAEMEQVAHDYGVLSGLRLEKVIDSMKVMPLGWREEVELKEVPLDLELTRPLEEIEAERNLVVPGKWHDALWELIDGVLFLGGSTPAAFLFGEEESGSLC